MGLRNELIKLAHANPELRQHLLPLIKSAGAEKTAVNATALSRLSGQFEVYASSSKILAELFKNISENFEALSRAAQEEDTEEISNLLPDLEKDLQKSIAEISLNTDMKFLRFVLRTLYTYGDQVGRELGSGD
jgi:hypothetical protein